MRGATNINMILSILIGLWKDYKGTIEYIDEIVGSRLKKQKKHSVPYAVNYW